jgi:hypothetical protein
VKRLLLLLSACTPQEVSLGAWDAYVPTGDARAQEDGSPYFEAEDGVLSGGFMRIEAGDASHGAALAAPSGTFDTAPGEARAVWRHTAGQRHDLPPAPLDLARWRMPTELRRPERPSLQRARLRGPPADQRVRLRDLLRISLGQELAEQLVVLAGQADAEAAHAELEVAVQDRVVEVA